MQGTLCRNQACPSLVRPLILSRTVPSKPGLSWPNQYVWDLYRKLRLELQVRKIKLAQIKQVFPRVLELELTLSQTQLDGEDILPLSDIWEQWPNLEELKITGERKGAPRNYDASFLGINEEEVELLRQTCDEGHLRALNIVPIRPSLLAMPSKF